jgi:hypothetical protein
MNEWKKLQAKEKEKHCKHMLRMNIHTSDLVTSITLRACKENHSFSLIDGSYNIGQGFSPATKWDYKI